MSNTNMNQLQCDNDSGIFFVIDGGIYDDILSKCRKNKSKTCRHTLSYVGGNTTSKIYLDSEEKLYFKDNRKQGLFTLLMRVASLEELKKEGETTEAEDYKELLEFCINNIRDTENNSISDFRKMKWITFCEKNKGAHILTEALTEYNKRKRIEELKEDIEKLKESLVEELEKEEEEEEEKEYEYNAYSLTKSLWDGGGRLKVNIMVAGGGLMNGNAYANIECEYKTEEDYENGEEGEIFYCEYGSNPSRRCVGTRIIWGEDDNFNIE